MNSAILGRDLGAVVVAYKRSENLPAIIQAVQDFGIQNIQIHIDGPKSHLDRDAVRRTYDVAHSLSDNSPVPFKIVLSEVNKGSARSVIESCQSLFDGCEFGIVLEDDCIPHANFFDFVCDSLEFLDKDSNVVMICGSQFQIGSFDTNIISSYPNVWGWATNKDSWATLQKSYERGEKRGRWLSVAKLSEKFFWNTGWRRSLEGYVDAWDIPLACHMRRLGLTAIHSRVNLIKNVGNDSAALHVALDDIFCNFPYGKYELPNEAPRTYEKYDDFIRKNVYRISMRNILTGTLRALTDKFGFSKRVRAPLSL